MLGNPFFSYSFLLLLSFFSFFFVLVLFLLFLSPLLFECVFILVFPDFPYCFRSLSLFYSFTT